MRIKKIMSIILIATIALGGLGCSKNDESTSTSDASSAMKNESSTDVKDEAKQEENVEDEILIKPTKENVLKLGSTQIPAIKSVLDAHGLVTSYRGSEVKNCVASFSKTEKDFQKPGGVGWDLYTAYFYNGHDVVESGVDNNICGLTYSSGVDLDGDADYFYAISISFLADKEFNIDNFPIFKELVGVVFGSDYDFKSLETWIIKYSDGLKTEKSKIGSVSRNTGSYEEKLDKGNRYYTKDCKTIKTISYQITLRKQDKK